MAVQTEAVAGQAGSSDEVAVVGGDQREAEEVVDRKSVVVEVARAVAVRKDLVAVAQKGLAVVVKVGTSGMPLL